MSRFLQLHLLTFYPPANLNRDDAGRPKSAVVGGTPRLRVSSQSLKRAWRKSDVFMAVLDGHLGDRTRKMGRNVALLLVRDHGLSQADANAIGRVMAAIFGKLETAPKRPEHELFIRQLAFISPDEQRKLNTLLTAALADQNLRTRLLAAADDVALDNEQDSSEAETESKSKKAKKQSKETTKLIKEIREEILLAADTAADIAMFGRMLADAPGFNREAAVQVAHAITTHRALVEDDYYTAVDDLKNPKDPDEDAGAGFIGEQGFGSGVFYLYACADVALLTRNLGGDAALAGNALAALAEAAATVAPSGKQASFASRARAHYVFAERGSQQPRTLAGAFVPAVDGGDPLGASIAKLKEWRGKLDGAYGAGADATKEMDVPGGTGTLAAIVAFCRAAATER